MIGVGTNRTIDFAYQCEPVVPQDSLWVYNEYYDLVAKTAAPSTTDQMRGMVRQALADRFKFKGHVETKDGPVLALVLGPKPRLEESTEEGGAFGIFRPTRC